MKEINNFPGYYIHEEGYVTKNERKLATSLHRKGYIVVNLAKDKKNYSCKLHRLLAIAFIPNPDNLPVVDHINHNRQDNRLENLRWVDWNINAQNRIKPITNTTGEMNIVQLPDGYFEVQITRNGTMVYRHREKTLEAATNARNKFLETGEQTRRQTSTNHKHITKVGNKFRVTIRKGTKQHRTTLFDRRFDTLEEAIFARDAFLDSL